MTFTKVFLKLSNASKVCLNLKSQKLLLRKIYH